MLNLRETSDQNNPSWLCVDFHLIVFIYFIYADMCILSSFEHGKHSYCTLIRGQYLAGAKWTIHDFKFRS